MPRSVLLTLAMVLGVLGTQANAAFTVTFAQVGNDVVATGRGSLDLTGVTGSDQSFINPQMVPRSGVLVIGSRDLYREYLPYFTSSQPFGTGGSTLANTSTGLIAGIVAGNSLLLSTSYVSGTQFTSTATFFDTTFAGLGLTPGTHNYAYSVSQGRQTLDTFTIQVGQPSVPEPSSLAMAGLGLASVGFVARRRRSDA